MGVLIFLGVLVLIMFLIIVIGRKGFNAENKFLKSFSTEPFYREDLELFNKLKKVTLADNTSALSKLDKNAKELQKLMKAGADAVLGSGIITRWKQQYVVVIAPNSMLTKKCIYEKSANGDDITAYLYEIDTRFEHCFNVTEYQETVAVSNDKKQVSVVGQAIVGGVIAGGVGAAVGAANAASKNAAGGKEYTTRKTESRYQLSRFHLADSIDTIYISTKMIKKLGQPPEKFVKSKNEDYWCIQATELGSRKPFERVDDLTCGLDRSAHDKLKAYIDKLLDCHKNSRHSVTASHINAFKNNNLA